MFKLSKRGACYFLLSKSRKDIPNHPNTKTLEDFCNMKEGSEEWKNMEKKLQKYNPKTTEENITSNKENSDKEELYNKYIKYSKAKIEGKNQTILEKLSYVDNVLDKKELETLPLLPHLTFNQPVDALNKEESFTYQIDDENIIEVMCPLKPEPSFHIKFPMAYEECKVNYQGNHLKNTTMAIYRGENTYNLQLYINNNSQLKYPFIILNDYIGTHIRCNSEIFFLKNSKAVQYAAVHTTKILGDGKNFCYEEAQVYIEDGKEYILLYQYPNPPETINTTLKLEKGLSLRIPTTNIQKFLIEHDKETITQTATILLVSEGITE